MQDVASSPSIMSRNKINIRLAGPKDLSSWDAYVSSHSNATPYHLIAWQQAMEQAYGHKNYSLLAEKENRIVGIFPLCYLRPPLSRGQLVSLPFCDIGGVLSDSATITKELIREAVNLSKKLHVSLLEIRTDKDTGTNDSTDLPQSTESHKVRMLLPLPASSQKLWEDFPSKLRSQVRKAEKNGLSFEWGNAGNIDDFYRVFSRNMRDIGSPVHAKEWILSVMKTYAERVRMGLVYKDHEPVGCSILLCLGHKASVPWASTLQEFNRLAPNMLLYWKMLQYAADNGFQEFDFGRSTPDEGTYRFKAQWGAQPVPLFWHRIHVDENIPAPGEKSSTKRATAAALWQKLPLPVANLLGPIIRKYISL